MVKISNLPSDSAPASSILIPHVDTTASPQRTEYATLANIITTIFNNVPAGAIPGSIFDYVISGGVWSGDAYASTRAASMTAITIYINSRSISISAVTARTFTASKDTYVDILDNLDGTGTLVYTEVANNAASPALASNSMRIAIVVTGATTIAAAGSINQGQHDKVLPIASSTPYQVTDSLGNLICPRDPNRRVLGYRQRTTDFTSSSSGDIEVTGLNVPVIVPPNRGIRVRAWAYGLRSASAAPHVGYARIYDGTVAGAIEAAACALYVTIDNNNLPQEWPERVLIPASSSKTYTLGISIANTNSKVIPASSTAPAFIMVELM